MTIGKKYRFGKYTWTLLDIQDGKGLFLLSGLLKERKAFHDTFEDITWERSDLCVWVCEWLEKNFTAKQLWQMITFDLLSVEEYQKYKHLIPKVPHWWWLRSQYAPTYVVGVYGHGKMFSTNTHDGNLGGVRPALWVELPKGGGTE